MDIRVEYSINLTEEQERMWKKLSTTAKPPVFGNYGAYSYASYAPPPQGVSFKTRYGYTTVANTKSVGIVIGA